MFKKNKNKAQSNPTNNVNQTNQVNTNQTTNKPVEQVNQVQQPVELPAKAEPKKVFNAEERLLYEFKPDKEKNPIVVVFIFLFVIGFIFCLPYLTKKIDFQRITKPNVAVEEEKEDEFYFFDKTSVRAKFEGLEFTNFVKVKKNGEYQVHFTINNTLEKAYLFNKKYYILFYNDNDVMIYRALIHSYDSIGSKGALMVKLPITKGAYERADRFKIQEIPVVKYTSVELNTNEGEYKTLSCVRGNDTIKYFFKEGLLNKIHEVYKEEKEPGSSSALILYENNLNKYKVLSKDYRDKAKINSVFIESNDRFEMRNEIDLKLISEETLRNLETYKFFKYNETKEVVSFELEAQGYVCS